MEPIRKNTISTLNANSKQKDIRNILAPTDPAKVEQDKCTITNVDKGKKIGFFKSYI